MRKKNIIRGHIQLWKRCNNIKGGFFRDEMPVSLMNDYISDCFKHVRSLHPEAMFRDEDLEDYLLPPGRDIGRWRETTPAKLSLGMSCSSRKPWPRSWHSSFRTIEPTPIQKSIEAFIQGREGEIVTGEYEHDDL